jgi:hypothetical protein
LIFVRFGGIISLFEQQENIVSYKIYVDLDGVLVDFDKEADRIGFPVEAFEADSQVRARFWHNIGKMARHGFEFWGVMDKMADADVLWSRLMAADHAVEILSATGHVGNADAEKRKWVETHLGDVVVNLVRKSKDKATFAAPTAILIDDRKKSIEPWVAAGGIGVLHVSAEDTIRQLEELGVL